MIERELFRIFVIVGGDLKLHRAARRRAERSNAVQPNRRQLAARGGCEEQQQDE